MPNLVQATNENIIPIKIEANENQEPILSGRELHEFLEVKTKYNDWFNRMLSYGFDEKIDFIPITQKRVTAQGNETTYIDHVLKLDMAKEIAMIQRSEKGKQARKYFLQIEKEWNSPEKVMARALILANKTIEKKDQKIKLVEEENIKLAGIIESQKPKLDYLDEILSSDDALLVTAIAFDYGLSAQALNKILCEERVQRKVRNQYILYSDYLGKGYTKTETRMIGEKPRVQTLWTQKGRMLIHDVLSKRQIKALMDLELA